MKSNSKSKAAFFDPTRHLRGYKLSEQRRPTNLQESNELYTTLAKRAMTFLIGENKNEHSKKDRYDILNFDPFFMLFFDLFEEFKDKKPRGDDKPKLPTKGSYNSSLGVFHYVNFFVPLLLLVELALIKMKRKALENDTYEKGWEKNKPLLVTTYALYGVVASHLMMASIILHSWWAVIQALIAITLVTLTSAIWYPIALAVTESPVKYDINNYEYDKDYDYQLMSSDESWTHRSSR